MISTSATPPARAAVERRAQASASDCVAAPPELMTVTVRDRASESPWGSGLTNPITRTVEISALCPVCGGRRGQPTGLNSHEDGAWYWVQTWSNPCRHVDAYSAVLAEARQLTLSGDGE